MKRIGGLLGGVVFTLAIGVALSSSARAGDGSTDSSGSKGTIGVICTDQFGHTYSWNDRGDRRAFSDCVSAAIEEKARTNGGYVDTRSVIHGYSYVDSILRNLVGSSDDLSLTHTE